GTGTGPGGNGCEATETRLFWSLGLLPGGGDLDLTYTAQVSPAAAGGAEYRNDATLAGGSLQNGSLTPDPTERTYDDPADATVTVQRAELVKSVKPGTTETPTIGERVTYVVSTTVPADVNLYQASLIDTLPRGL